MHKVFIKFFFITFSLVPCLIVWATSIAASLRLECPTQQYILAGSESDYYYINGTSKLTWQNTELSTSNHGRFLDPGLPRSTALQTQSMDVHTNDDGAGLSYYCYLSDRRDIRVAFTVTNIYLKDFGIEGKLSECSNRNNHILCNVF